MPIHASFVRAFCALSLVVGAFAVTMDASAVAAFARQTGMSCNQCHLSHGAATPNFTFTGRKFRALGYRVPNVRVPVIKKGESEDQGEHLLLNPSAWSGRFLWDADSNLKPPGGDWGEDKTNPAARLSIFPFVGSISEHFGIWTEIYLLPEVSGNDEWSISNGSYEEHDFRYTINPNGRNVYGLAISNQDAGSLFGFGPWPAVGLDLNVQRGNINGWAHPNFGTLYAYGWMHDRWVWAFGENTGDSNFGWNRSNETGMFGYAFKNGFSHELWANLYFRKGNDVIPLVTQTSIPPDRHDFYYSDSIVGISATRPAPCPATPTFVLTGCPYLAEDIDDSTTVAAEVRWARQDVGDWSWEIVGRVETNTEDYRDGAGTDEDTWGVATQFAWRHRYYIKPYVKGHREFAFRDFAGTRHEVDTKPDYGIWLAYKPVENFLLAFQYHRIQSWSVAGEALDDGARYSITADISF